MKALRMLAIAIVAWGCATNPATGRRQLMLMSEQEEVQIGRQNHEQIRQQMGVYNDPELQRYVAEIGARLVRESHRPNLPWTFTVVDEAAVNAFALPGGFIYLTRGILPFLRNEAELAGVLGHEIGHVDARHSAEAYSKQLGAGLGLAVASVLAPQTQAFQGLAGAGLEVLFLKYGREAELESDRLGVTYASTLGWDPRGVPGMLNTLARIENSSGTRRGIPNWALTHPPAADRVARVQEAVAAAPPSATSTNAAAFERHLDGLVYGDSREKGIVRGNEFLHPIMRFSLRFPEGWEIVNGAEQVVAQPDEQQGNRAMILQLAERTAGSIEQVATSQMREGGWRQVSGQRTQVNGLDAYVGTYEGVSGETPVIVQAAHVRSGNQVFVVAGIATPQVFQSASRTFSSAIGSFRALSQQEADRIQANRLDFYVVRPGDTWESIAKSRSGGAITASMAAIMNGNDPGTSPRPGERIRIVVGG
jgi:predicted Zn-dependent protease